jgi:hypothetical protein
VQAVCLHAIMLYLGYVRKENIYPRNDRRPI